MPGGGAPPARRTEAGAPLADRMRPRTLDEIVGQDHLLGPGRVLRTAIERSELHSMILWGVKEIRAVIADADAGQRRHGRPTILFVDEIHRFNRAQQDAFLPHVEKGTIILVGATTENPSFEVNGALLSRCRVYVLHALDEAALIEILKGAIADPERGLGRRRALVRDAA